MLFLWSEISLISSASYLAGQFYIRCFPTSLQSQEEKLNKKPVLYSDENPSIMLLFIISKKEPLAKFFFQFLVYIWPTICQVPRLLFLSFSTLLWEITSSLHNIHAYSPFLKLMFPYRKLSARSWRHPKHRLKIVLRNTYILYYPSTQGQTLSRTWDSFSFPTVTKCKPGTVYCWWRRQKKTSKVLQKVGKNKCYRGQSHLA